MDSINANFEKPKFLIVSLNVVFPNSLSRAFPDYSTANFTYYLSGYVIDENGVEDTNYSYYKITEETISITDNFFEKELLVAK
ncbi:MAG: hypothetical protein GX220_09370 [Treponema sp.]|nr:hypothetical protein [Treponema sp.]